MNKHFKSIPESISKSAAQNKNSIISNDGQKKVINYENKKNSSSSSDLKNQESNISYVDKKDNIPSLDLKNQGSSLSTEKIKNWGECASLENTKPETTILLVKWLLQATDISYFSAQAFLEVRNIYRKRNNLSSSLYFQPVLDFLERKKGDLTISNYKYKSFFHSLVYDVFVSACRNCPNAVLLEKSINLALELDMNLKITKKDIVFLTKTGVDIDILNRYQLMF